MGPFLSGDISIRSRQTHLRDAKKVLREPRRPASFVHAVRTLAPSPKSGDPWDWQLEEGTT